MVIVVEVPPGVRLQWLAKINHEGHSHIFCIGCRQRFLAKCQQLMNSEYSEETVKERRKKVNVNDSTTTPLIDWRRAPPIRGGFD